MLKTKRDVMELYGAMEACANYPSRVKFSYAIAANRRLLKPIVDSVKDSQKPTPAVLAFDKAHKDLVLRHTEIDPVTRKPVIGPDKMRKIKDVEAYQADFEVLRSRYAGAQEELENINKQVNELLAEPLDKPLELVLCPLEQVPDGMTPALMEGIFDMIRID